LYDYIAADNPTAAAAQVDLIRGTVQHLAQFPHIGRPGRIDKTHEFAVPGTPYIVAYTVRATDVLILAVLHGARRWPSQF
jgi:plasmid stabilization system protein ParE